MNNLVTTEVNYQERLTWYLRLVPVGLGLWVNALYAVESAPNGLQLPADYKAWQILSVSHRTDKNSLRGILGNDIAMRAARSGAPTPWPVGSVLVKLVWKEKAHEKWPTAIVPGELMHIEIMVKDPQRFTATGGWGYARWQGTGLTPYGQDAGFARECFDCHSSVRDTDFVFTQLPVLP